MICLVFWHGLLVIWSVNLAYQSGILAIWYTKGTKIPQIRARRFGGDKALGAELFRSDSRRIASQRAGAWGEDLDRI